MEELDQVTDNDMTSVLAAGMAMADPKSADGDFVIIPEGYKLEDLEQYQLTPHRISEKLSFWTLDDLIRYCHDYDDAETAVFVNRFGAVAAVLDYHVAGDPDGARWADHTATFEPVITDAWRAWTDRNDKWLNQVDFAEFLEDHVLDVTTPDGADLLECARDLRIQRNVKFKSRTNLTNGNVEFGYTTEDSATSRVGQLIVPETFTIFLEALEGFGAIERECKLRYRMESGNLKLGFHIVRVDEVRRDLRDKILSRLEEDLTAVYRAVK